MNEVYAKIFKMSRTRVNNSRHSYDRARDRTNLSKRAVEKLIKEASSYGVSAGSMPNGPLRRYIASKGDKKRVKYFKGYVFVFAKTSTSCITMYPADEEVIEAEKEARKNK